MFAINNRKSWDYAQDNDELKMPRSKRFMVLNPKDGDCREEFNRKLKAEFSRRNIPVVLITGSYEERMKKAQELVNRLLLSMPK